MAGPPGQGFSARLPAPRSMRCIRNTDWLPAVAQLALPPPQAIPHMVGCMPASQDNRPAKPIRAA